MNGILTPEWLGKKKPGAKGADGCRITDTESQRLTFDTFNERVYIFSHPTKDATVIDAKDGTVLGRIDLGGVPEEGIADGRGKLYDVMQDAQGSVAVVDVKTMKTTAHYPFGDKGRCNGLALDAKNHILFAACGNSGNPPADPPQPMMVILNADTGKILANLPLPGGSDGAIFNAATMEAYSTQGSGTLTIVKENSPTSFEVEQKLPTMNGARTTGRRWPRRSGDGKRRRLGISERHMRRWRARYEQFGFRGLFDRRRGLLGKAGAGSGNGASAGALPGALFRSERAALSREAAGRASRGAQL